MRIRRLTDHGRETYRAWLEQRKSGDMPPAELLTGEELTEEFLNLSVDLSMTFATRYEFGEYLTQLLSSEDHKALLSAQNDGLWDWITIAYFRQLGRKMSKPWHYAVTRRGHLGSLAYRHLARTTFEMYLRHGESSLVMLLADMGTWGDLSEQLTSRQKVANHRGYISAANAIYLREGKIVPKAASRPRSIKKRKVGDTMGRGSVGRLAIAVDRLGRTFDTHNLSTNQMISLLPLEFRNFSNKLQ